MKNYKKGFAGIIAIIIVAVGILGFGAYKVFHKASPTPEEQNAPISNFPADYKPADHTNTSSAPANTNVALSADTSSWKTYKNVKGGFEVKYPADWQLLDSDLFAAAKLDAGGNNSGQTQINDVLAQRGMQSKGLQGNIDYVQLNGGYSKTIPIDGGQAFYSFTDGGQNYPTFYSASLVSNDHIYQLTYESAESKSEMESKFLQMLSTFKFTK